MAWTRRAALCYEIYITRVLSFVLLCCTNICSTFLVYMELMERINKSLISALLCLFSSDLISFVRIPLLI